MTQYNDNSPVGAGKKQGGDFQKNNDAYKEIFKMIPLTTIAFTIPKTDNSGNPFREELFGWIDKSLCELGGGFHYLPAVGVWLPKNGVVQLENCRKYYVEIENDRVPDLFQLLVQAKEVFYQEALYFEWKWQSFIF